VKDWIMMFGKTLYCKSPQ